jgi:hypothetical protein
MSLHYIIRGAYKNPVRVGYRQSFSSSSPSPRTSLKSTDSDFENTSDSDSACLFVYAFIL